MSPRARAARGVGRRLYGSLLAMLRAQGFHGAFAGSALPNDASVRLPRGGRLPTAGCYREVGFKFGAGAMSVVAPGTRRGRHAAVRAVSFPAAA